MKNFKKFINTYLVSLFLWHNNTKVTVKVYPRIDETDTAKWREKYEISPKAMADINVNETKVIYGIKITLKEVKVLDSEVYAILTMMEED